MPPIVSKLTSAIDDIDPTGTANGNFSSSSGSSICEENQIFVDPNLAHIISNVVSNIISNPQKTLRKKKRNCKYPCSVCVKNGNKNQKAIACSYCEIWSYASCNGIGKSEYDGLVAEDDDVPWYCLTCLIAQNSEIFPFGLVSKSEMFELSDVDLPSQVDNLPSFEIISKLSNMPNLNSSDLDENFIHTINKYYKTYDLPKISNHHHTKDFSLFHVTIRGLSKHFDEVHTLLHASKIPFDVIAITESKQSLNNDFLTNVTINDYQLHTQPSKSACGGIATYVKKSLDHLILSNLNALEDEYETLWVEMNTGPQSKNIFCCCAYRHPDTDASKFIDYMESTLSKIENKNKIICVMGDFNLNLFNYETHTHTNDYVNSMVSHCLIPHILQPTSVTDHSATVIDNIFSNVTDYETTSGNILNQVADIHKDSAYYTYDYSDFDNDSLLDDFSKISWDNYDNARPLDINEKFHNFHRKVTSYVTTHVPIIKVSRKKLTLKAKPWISNRIEHMMVKPDRYLRKFNHTFNKDMEYLYKKFRNKVVSELRKSKTKYYNKYFDTHKSNMKQLWAGIRSIVDWKYKVGSCVSYLIHENVKVEDSKGMASIFNNVFVNTANKINETIFKNQKVTTGLPDSKKFKFFLCFSSHTY